MNAYETIVVSITKVLDVTGYHILYTLVATQSGQCI